MSREQFLWDVFVTACEGGINYWARIERYHHSTNGKDDLEGFHAKIFDTEEEKRHDIHRATIEHGLKAFQKPGVHINAELRGQILAADVTNGENVTLDAEGADAVVQAGLFGQVVYG